MNVLESFYYLFESDTSKLDAGVKKSEKSAEGLKKQLDATDKTANALGSSFLTMARAAGVAVAGLVSYTALSALVTNVTASTDALGKQAQALGISAGELDVWGAAAGEAGGSLDGFTGSLGAFNERVQDAAVKGSAEVAKLFGRFGVGLDTIKAKAGEPLALLLEMSEGVEKMSEAEVLGLGKMLGLDVGTINLLRQGRTGIEEALRMQRELGYVTDDQAEKAARYNDAIARGKRVWDDVRRQVVFAVVPLFERLATMWETGGRLAREHSGAIKWAFGVISIAATAMLAPALIRAAVAAWALVAPFALVAVAVLAVGAAVALVADDLYNFMQGNDSVVGAIAERWPIVGEVIRAVGEALAYVIATAVGFGAALAALFSGGPQAAIETLREHITALAADIEARFPALAGLADLVTAAFGYASAQAALAGEVFSSVWAALTGDIDGVSDKLGGLTAPLRMLGGVMQGILGNAIRMWETLASVIGRVAGAIGEFLGGDGATFLQGVMGAGARVLRSVTASTNGAIGRDPLGSLRAAQPQLAPSATPAVGAVSSGATLVGGATSSRTTSVSVTGVEINTQATDAAGIASAFGTELDRQLRSASDQADDGVLA